jgi:DNA (cytosine-5)-methyltransferase 1
MANQSHNTPENHLRKKPGRKVVTDLAIVVENGLLESGGELLPTPQAGEPLLGGQAKEMATDWGKYGPAIRRWEQVTRPAPAPTEPNKNGNPRLAAAFSEWMLGWPAGWVSDVDGLTRNDMLRIIGNGVCAQQCFAALQYLIQFIEVDP